MKTIYRASFNLGKIRRAPDEKGPSREQLIDLSRQWLGEKFLKEIPTEEINQPRFSLKNDEGMRLESYLEEERDREVSYFGMEFSQPDMVRRHDTWKVSLASRFSCRGAVAEITLGTESLLGDMNGAAEKELSKPKLVSMIVESMGAFDMIPIRNDALGILPEEAEFFAELIANPERKIPLIYVSRVNITGNVIINTMKTAGCLAGIAHVVVPKNLETSKRIEGLVGDNKCYNGAVRIYWPAVAKEMFNSCYTPQVLLRRGVFGEMDFAKEALRVISKFSVMGHPEITIDEIRRVGERKYLKFLKDGNEFEKLALSIADDNTALQAELERYKKINSSLEQRCALMADALDQKKATINANEFQPGTGLVISSVYDAVIAAQDVFNERLVFLPKVIDSVRASNFNNPKAVFCAFRELATTYLDSKSGLANIPDLYRFFTESCGFNYGPVQNEGLMKRYEEEYRMTLPSGEKVFFEQHLKYGGGRNPATNLRIAFYYNNKDKKVYVGYVGTHQKLT